jgi:hypothetical protein
MLVHKVMSTVLVTAQKTDTVLSNSTARLRGS